MPVYARIDWDEENNPKAFYICWAISQFVLLILAVLIHLHALDSIALTQVGHSSGERLFGFLFYVILMVTGTLYLNLIINGIWHRNPDSIEPNESDTDSVEIESLNLQPIESTISQVEPRELFAQSELKDPDPVITRDEIQWKRILWASICASTIIASLALLG